MGSDTYDHIASQTVPSSDSLHSYCCQKTWHTVDSYPNFLDVSKHKLLAYLQEFGWLTQFDHPSVGDRLNCESSESRGTRAVAPNSERWTATLDRKWSSSDLRASITHTQCRSQHTSQLCTWCWRYEVSRSGGSINGHPNRVNLAGRNKLQGWISFDIHDSAKQMKDKRLKSLAKL